MLAAIALGGAACALASDRLDRDTRPTGGAPAVAKPDDKAQPTPKYTTETLRGRVVWMAEALRRRYGIDTDDDAAHASAALETAGGELYPLVKDFRGRGFWLDPRLHELDLELVVRRYKGSPAVQVVRVYTLRQGRRHELDYWCDICAIPMYELKACECCQGPTRLRERLVEAP